MTVGQIVGRESSSGDFHALTVQVCGELDPRLYGAGPVSLTPWYPTLTPNLEAQREAEQEASRALKALVSVYTQRGVTESAKRVLHALDTLGLARIGS